MTDKRMAVSVLIGGMMTLTGCSGGSGGASGVSSASASASLVLRLGSGQVVSRLASDTSRLTVQLTPSSGAPLTATLSQGQTSVAFNNLPLGPAQVTVEGFNSKQVEVSQGQASATLVAGANTVTVVTEPAPEFVYIPQIGSNAIAQFSINMSDGTLTPLSPPTVNAQGAQPVSGTADALGRFVYYGDLGGTNNQIEGFQVGIDGTLTPIAGSLQPTGASPNLFPIFPTFDASNQFLYVSNSFANPDVTIQGYRVDSQGGLTPLAPVDTQVPRFLFGAAGPLRANPTQEILYATDAASGVTTLAVQANGALSIVGAPDTGFVDNVSDVGLAPNGAFAVLVQNPNTLSGPLVASGFEALQVAANGTLQEFNAPQTGALAALTAANVVAVHPSGLFAYVSDSGSPNVQTLNLNPATGQVSLGATVATGLTAANIDVIDPAGQFLFITNIQSQVSVMPIHADGTLGAPQVLSFPTGAGEPVFVRGGFP